MSTTKALAKKAPRKRRPKPVITPAPVGPLEARYVIRMPYLDPPATMNDTRAGGSHWTRQRSAHDDVMADVCRLMKHHKVPRIRRCTVSVVWCRTDNDRVDNDALGVFLKGAKDGLVLAGVVSDDRCQVIVSDTMEIHPNSSREGLYVVIEPVSRDWRSALADVG